MILTTVVLLAFSVPVPRSIQPPDFSGTWVVDQERSDLAGPGERRPPDAQAPPRPGDRGQGRMGGPRHGGPFGPLDATLLIRQEAGELIIEREGAEGAPLVVPLDGTERTVRGVRGDMRVRAEWEDARLITHGDQTIDTPRGTMQMTMRQVRWLEDGGRTMIVEMTLDTPRGSDTRRLVYTKRED